MAIVKMDEVFDCIYTRPYAEDDALLNDFVDNAIGDKEIINLRHVSLGHTLHQRSDSQGSFG